MSRELLYVVRGRGTATETEPVVATVIDGRLTLDLDDGDRLVLDMDDLLRLSVAEDGGLEAPEAA